MDKLKLVSEHYLRKDLPALNAGDQIKVFTKILEGDKVRIHPFEGTVMRTSGHGINASFTVRKVSYGEGVERTFPLHSPVIDKIEIIKRGKVRRARLYYLRGKSGRSARIEEEKQASVAATPEKA